MMFFFIKIINQVFVCTFNTVIRAFSTWSLCHSYGGWFGALLCVSLALATTGQRDKRRVVALSSCRPVSSAARNVAMSHCHSVQIEGLAYKPKDRAISKQCAARQRAVWHAAIETGRQCDNAPFGALKCCRWRQNDKTRRLACRDRDKTTVQQCAVWRFNCCVVASAN
jgi:hypothetical protein